MFICADIKSETVVHKFLRRHLMYSLTEFPYTGETYGFKLYRQFGIALQEYVFLLGQKEG